MLHMGAKVAMTGDMQKLQGRGVPAAKATCAADCGVRQAEVEGLPACRGPRLPEKLPRSHSGLVPRNRDADVMGTRLHWARPRRASRRVALRSCAHAHEGQII